MDYIDETFGAGGYLARRTPGYAPRPAQITYARAVDDTLSGRHGPKHLLAEGATGTGKSYGYLVPATWHAVNKGRKVVVVTSNIALQEQLVQKDLPALAEALPWRFTYALMKGKNNYLCAKRSEEMRISTPYHDYEMEQARQELIGWSALTADGDMSGLPSIPPPKVWRDFSVTSEECTGSACPFWGECFSRKARDKARQAHVIVTNYHVLFAHLRAKAITGADLVLPPLDIVVMDEAHEAAEIARDFFGADVREGTIRWIGQKCADQKMRAELDRRGSAFFAALQGYRRSHAYHRRLKEESPVEWRGLYDQLSEIAGWYRDAARQAEGEEKYTLARRSDKATQVAGDISQAMNLEDPELRVYYLDSGPQERVSLRSAPIYVGAELGPKMFQANPGPQAIITSATLSVDGSFVHVAEQLGLGGDYGYCQVDSPFRWDTHALLVLPQSMPEPTSPSYPEMVGVAIDRAVEHARGRTLALFTSYRGLDAAHAVLKESTKYTLLRQGELPRTTLVEMFKHDTHSVLLGTDSFWQGVDVPGEALACLVIDKIPFPSPDDPVLDALTQLHKNWFERYSLPAAILKMKQGVGRLIRTAGDYGVVVLCDPRLQSKGYGRKILNSLPAMPTATDLRAVRTFLDKAYPPPAATTEAAQV